jgi:alpha-galactosidase
MLLWNLANPQARQFLTDFLCGCIRDWGIDCYRQDFNMGMLNYCRKADAPDRVGMTEIRYVEGLYTFWDDLLKRNPGLIIDNCASGGKRLDFEMLRRATPFWRTDGPRDPIAHQCHTWGLMLWVPLSAASEDRKGDDYEFRSSMCSALATNWWSPGDVPADPIPADFPWDWAKRTLEQYLKIRKCYYGDYYPLTGYSQARDVWMAYQLDLPESGEGLVVALRRPESPYETARLKLHGLEAGAQYEITNLDTNQKQTLAGQTLLTDGAEVSLKSCPGSALLTYRRAR